MSDTNSITVGSVKHNQGSLITADEIATQHDLQLRNKKSCMAIIKCINIILHTYLGSCALIK